MTHKHTDTDKLLYSFEHLKKQADIHVPDFTSFFMGSSSYPDMVHGEGINGPDAMAHGSSVQRVSAYVGTNIQKDRLPAVVGQKSCQQEANWALPGIAFIERAGNVDVNGGVKGADPVVGLDGQEKGLQLVLRFIFYRHLNL